VKKLSRFDSALTITLYFSFIGTLFSIVPAMFNWVWPTPFEYLLLVATGITGVSGLMCAARAYSLADATVGSPVDFTRLPFAAVIGYVIFGETLDILTLSGAVIIMVSILYIGRRTRVQA
jgi:drug/metabolite transporter (DMT)-like permease